MIEKLIELNYDEPGLQRTSIILNQANKNSVVYNFKVRKGVKEADYLSYTHAELVFKLKNGTAVTQNSTVPSNNVTISADGIRCVLNENVFGAVGEVQSYIKLFKNEKISAPLQYGFNVISDLLDITRISKFYIGTIEELVEALNITVEEARQILDELQNDSFVTNQRFNTTTNAIISDVSLANSRIDNLVANDPNTDGNSELIDIRTDAFGTSFATAGNSVRAISSLVVPKQKLVSLNIGKNQGTASFSAFYNDLVALFEYNKPSGYARITTTLGSFGTIKGKSYKLHIKNESANNMTLSESLEVGLSSVNDWGVTSYWLTISSISLKYNEEAIINVNVPISREGWTDSSLIRLVIRDQSTVTGLNNDNKLRFYLTLNNAHLRFGGGYDSVNNAVNADTASRATLADSAVNAVNADNADRAAFADNADNANRATLAVNADNADTANRATLADNAVFLESINKAIKMPLYNLGSKPTLPYPNTIGLTSYTDNLDVIGFTMDASIENTNYLYSYARLTKDQKYSDLKNKKIRIFVRSEEDAFIKIVITNGNAWGSGDNTIAESYSVEIRLDNENLRSYSLDIDLSDEKFETFYSASQRQIESLQSVYYIVAFNKDSNFLADIGDYQIHSYVYELTDSAKSIYEGSLNSRHILDLALGEDTRSKFNLIGDRIKLIEDRTMSDYANSIVCWGDSLTAGGGWTDRLSELSNLAVFNAGTGGETARTIMARQGGDIMIVDNITIPPSTSEILIASKPINGGIATQLGYLSTPLLQGGGSHVNPCAISGIEGTLRWTGTNYADINGTWTWKRNISGTQLMIDRPTALITAFDKTHNRNKNGITIIFMGQNGGYSDIDDLINMHKLMIAHCQSKHTVILGLSSGTAESRNDYETAMRLAFGRYFISLRAYLSKYGMDDAGLTPTQADLDAMAIGQVPPSLLKDTVHYTEETKIAIGNFLYKRMTELNIF